MFWTLLPFESFAKLFFFFSPFFLVPQTPGRCKKE